MSFSSPEPQVLDAGPAQVALHQLVEAVAVALLEGRALRLAVVGEHDDLVGARGVLPGARDAPELLVELAQHLHGVRALEARVVRHLVVAGEAGVDGGHAHHHVADDAVHGEVAHEDGETGAHERVAERAVAARLHVPAPLPGRAGQLQRHLVEEEHEGARDVVAVGEVGPVPGVGLLLRLHPADGEDHVGGVARQQVAAAGAAVGQQPVAAGVPLLDEGAVGRRRAGHDAPRLLLHPAEGGDVVVGAEQQPRLRGAGLRREVRLPLGEPVRAGRQPARHLRRVAVADGALQHRPREAVDLEVDDAGNVGHLSRARAPRDALRDAQRVDVLVVGAQEHLEHHRHGGGDQRHEQRPEEPVHLEGVVGEVRRDHDHPRVEQEDEQEADGEHVRQAQRGDERRQHGVQDGDQRRGDERPERTPRS